MTKADTDRGQTLSTMASMSQMMDSSEENSQSRANLGSSHQSQSFEKMQISGGN